MGELTGVMGELTVRFVFFEGVIGELWGVMEGVNGEICVVARSISAKKKLISPLTPL